MKWAKVFRTISACRILIILFSKSSLFCVFCIQLPAVHGAYRASVFGCV